MEAWFEKIEKFIHGEMNEQEENLFRNEMDVNEELAAAYRIYKGVEDNMQNTLAGKEDEAALKASLASLNSKYFAGAFRPGLSVAGGTAISELPAKGKRTKMLWNARNILAIAAAVAAIILVSVLWLYNDTKKPGEDLAENKQPADTMQKNNSGMETRDTISIKREEIPQPSKEEQQSITAKITAASREALFDSYYEPDALPATTAGPLQKAMQQFEEGEYPAAIQSFREADLDATSRGQSEGRSKQVFYSHYYLALSYLSTNQPALSTRLFQQAISESPDDSFRNKSTWYLALAYLKTGESEKAMKHLHALAADQSAGKIKTKAQTLLNDLTPE